MKKPPHNVLLLGRKGIDLAMYREKIPFKNIQILGGKSLADVKAVFEVAEIDLVIMGAGIALEDRLEIISFVFNASDDTSVHMKDRASGPGGMLEFVNNVISGLWHTG